MYSLILLCMMSAFAVGLDDESYSVGHVYENKCGPKPVGIDWILSRRNKNYGWGLQTHRAIVAVFTAIFENKTYADQAEKNLMAHQLEAELSIALLRNNSGLSLPQSELALYIHALMIVGGNPKNFKGINLLKSLERQMMDHSSHVHPFSVLCICNSGALKERHIRGILNNLRTQTSGMKTTSEIERIAIIIKALSCAGDLNKDYQDDIQKATSDLIQFQQTDGSFGNIFTTSLVVQALKATALHYRAVQDAKNFLSKQKSSKLVDVYYIEMALRQFVFIRDYSSTQDYTEAPTDRKGKLFVTYSLMITGLPDTYITMSMHVPMGYTLFDVMNVAAKKNQQFKFLHSVTKGNPQVYSISNVTNNAEDGMYWRLFKETDEKCRHNDCLKELTSPVNEIPVRTDENYIYKYMDLFF